MYTTLGDFRNTSACSEGTRKALKLIGGRSSTITDATHIPFWFPILMDGSYDDWIMQGSIPYHHDTEDFAKFYAAAAPMTAFALSANILCILHRELLRRVAGSGGSEKERKATKAYLEPRIDTWRSTYTAMLNFLATFSEDRPFEYTSTNNRHPAIDFLQVIGVALDTSDKFEIANPTSLAFRVGGKHMSIADLYYRKENMCHLLHCLEMAQRGRADLLSVVEQMQFVRAVMRNLTRIIRWYNGISFSVGSAKSLRGIHPELPDTVLGIKLGFPVVEMEKRDRPRSNIRVNATDVAKQLPESLREVLGSSLVHGKLDAPRESTKKSAPISEKLQLSLWKYLTDEETNLARQWVMSSFDLNAFFGQAKLANEKPISETATIADVVKLTEGSNDTHFAVNRDANGQFQHAIVVIKNPYALLQFMRRIKDLDAELGLSEGQTIMFSDWLEKNKPVEEVEVKAKKPPTRPARGRAMPSHMRDADLNLIDDDEDA